MHLVSKCILGSLRSCCGWRSSNSMEAKWIWIAKHFNHRCCNFITYTAPLLHGRHDVAWDRQCSGSSHVHGSRVFWAHPHTCWCWREGFLVLMQTLPLLHPFSLLCLPLKFPQLQDLLTMPCRPPCQFWFSCTIVWAHHQLLWRSGWVCTVIEDTWLITLHLF